MSDEKIDALMKKVAEGRLADVAGYLDYELRFLRSYYPGAAEPFPEKLLTAFVAKLKEEGYE